MFCASATLSAQDRVILFEAARTVRGVVVPGEIREIEVADGGRRWTTTRTVELPPHAAGAPVALADGRHIVWLGLDVDRSKVLVQYDAVTGSAAIVPVRHFDRQAFLLADRVLPRVFVIEPTRVTVLDLRLQPAAIELPSVKGLSSGHVADRYLVIHRFSTGLASDADAVVIDTDAAAVTRVIPLGEFSKLQISRDGQRLYRAYSAAGSFEARLDIISVATGEVIARAVGPRPTYLFELDDTRGVIVYDDSIAGHVGVVVRDAATLALIGEFAPATFDRRRDFRLAQTAHDATILMFSREFGPGYFGCDQMGPRIDVFDGRSYALANRIDLQGRCPSIIPLR